MSSLGFHSGTVTRSHPALFLNRLKIMSVPIIGSANDDISHKYEHLF